MTPISRTLLTRIINFFSRSRCSLLGGVISVILAPVLLIAVLLDMQGLVQNPYCHVTLEMLEKIRYGQKKRRRPCLRSSIDFH